MPKQHIYQDRCKRLACRLPITGKIFIGNYNSGFIAVTMVARPNSVIARAFFGDEKILRQDDDILVSTNGLFIRYLRLTPITRNQHCADNSQLAWHPEMYPGCLLLKIMPNEKHFIDNIYVDPAFRHQGIATNLIEVAHHDFPHICLDGRFSEVGLDFFGATSRKRR